MSWLRNSPLRASFGKLRPSNSPPKNCDPVACYESFKKHWQQIHDIILRTQPPAGYPIQDDVLGVVNHLDQMVNLLVLDLRAGAAGLGGAAEGQLPCLEYLLSENLLDALFTWSVHTGRYANAVRLQQLKLYELLMTSAQRQLLSHEPFLRPLLKLLASCDGECFPVELEKRLVVLLNQLCVSLMQNVELLDLFFCASNNHGHTKFMIFTLLIPFVHREGAIGQQARDALLLCMSLSKKNENVGAYIAERSNVCPVLATGLSGLYSVLPRKLRADAEDWHRLTPDDVQAIPELAAFMNSLEFCNAVVQVAHPCVKLQMLEFLHQGFLVPVLGPALLQDSVGVTLEQLESPVEASSVEELVTATVYFDLFLRSISEPGLLYSFVKFLLEDKYDGERILDCLINRIDAKSRLCLVTLALFETLVDMNCEDVMLELVLKYLIPCTHVMLSQRRRVRDIEPYCRSSDKFLSLSPSCCSRPFPHHGVTPSPSLPAMQHRPAPPDLGQPSSLPSCESLYGNYHAYLCSARRQIRDCAAACSSWAYLYNGEDPSPGCEMMARNPEQRPREAGNRTSPGRRPSPEDTAGREDGLGESPGKTVDHTDEETSVDVPGREVSDKASNDAGPGDCGSLPGGDDSSPDGADVKSGRGSKHKQENVAEKTREDNQGGELPGEDVTSSAANCHSLPSIGESSGYESFALKGSPESTPENEPVDEDLGVCVSEDVQQHKARERSESSGSRHFFSRLEESWSLRKFSKESQNSYLDIFNTTPDIGPFLDVVLRRLECMMLNSVYVNLHLTGLISRLAVYPQPLLHSFLLNHSLVFQPSIRSLFQVLGSLKHKIDSYLNRQPNVEELVMSAQEFLLAREDKIVNARRNAAEASLPSVPNGRRSSSADTFTRGESKRRSFTSTLSSVFRRTTQPIQESRLETVPSGAGYRFVAKAARTGVDAGQCEVGDVVLCAVLLDEWLKELAAITQEQAMFALTSGCRDSW